MLSTRVIPCLLLSNRGLIKTTKFKKPVYLGDPINIVKIFNDKEVDELVMLDIHATVEKRKPNFELLAEIAGECFMPLGYGGGISSIDDIQRLFALGIEKVSVNTMASENPDLIRQAAEKFGSQSIVVSIDVRRTLFGKHEIFLNNAKNKIKIDLIEYVQKLEALGAGEVLLNSIDRDGTMGGYDIGLVSQISKSINIPVIACGGAGKIQDFVDVVDKGGASAVAAGSFFVFHGKHRAVLINVPSPKNLASSGLK